MVIYLVPHITGETFMVEESVEGRDDFSWAEEKLWKLLAAFKEEAYE